MDWELWRPGFGSRGPEEPSPACLPHSSGRGMGTGASQGSFSTRIGVCDFVCVCGVCWYLCIYTQSDFMKNLRQLIIKGTDSIRVKTLNLG